MQVKYIINRVFQFLYRVISNIYSLNLSIRRSSISIITVVLFNCINSVSSQHLVKDIYSGLNSSHPYFLCPAPGGLIFFAEDVKNGRELWFTDGTEQNTYLLADINPGKGGCGFLWPYEDTGYSIQIVSNGNQFQFWKTDGTVGGTKFLMNLNKYGSITLHGQMIKFKNKYYFQNYDSLHGYELWVADINWTQVHMFKDIVPNDSILKEVQIRGLIEVDNSLYFIANDSIYKNRYQYTIFKSDGTDTGTYKLNINQANPYSNLYSIGSDLYFIAQPDTGFSALCRYNTKNGVFEILYQDGIERIQSDLHIHGSHIYFRTYDYSNGRSASWVFDTQNTLLQKFTLSDPAITSYYIGSIHTFDTFTLLGIQSDLYGTEYWRLNQDGLGASFIYDFNPGPSGSINTIPIINKNGKAYFLVQNPNVFRLWESDGTIDNTRVYYEFNQVNDIRFMTFLNGKFILFGDFNSAYGNEIYAIDLDNSIETNQEKQIQIYPNPVSPGGTIKITHFELAENIKLIDMNGKIILVEAGEGEIKIPLHLNKGVYCLQIQLGEKILTRKIIVE